MSFRALPLSDCKYCSIHTYLHFDSPCLCILHEFYLLLPVLCNLFCLVSLLYNDAYLGRSSIFRKLQWAFLQCSCSNHMCSIGIFVSIVPFGFFPIVCFTYLFHFLHLYLFSALLQYTFCAGVCYRWWWPDHIRATLLDPVLLPEGRCAAVYSTV